MPIKPIQTSLYQGRLL